MRIDSCALGVLLVLSWVGTSSAAADYEVSARVEPSGDITDEESVRLIVQVDGGGAASVVPPRIHELKNLRVVSGPNQQVSTRWINGRTSSTFQLHYTLLPIGAGNAEIPSLAVQVDGKTYRTAPIRFEVIKVRPGTQPRPGSPQPRPGSPQPRAGSTPRAAARADVFVEAELPSSEVWVGQSVPLSVSLYMAERVYNLAWRQQPELANFWIEDLDVDPQGEAYRVKRDGQTYSVLPVKRAVLVPQTPGEFTIDPYVIEMQVRKRGSDPFDSLFNIGRLETVVRRTEPLNLVVNPLPSQGRPADFGGAVGSFKLTAHVDRTEAGVNDAVAVKATVEGEGFLGAVPAPKLEAPQDIKVFDPEVKATSGARRGALVSRKTWEWILVPTAPGDVQLPELSFSYFDPASGRYRTLREGLSRLVVRRSDRLGDEPRARADVRLQRRDLAFIKPLRGSLRERTPRAHERGLYLALLLAPLVWVPVFVYVGRHRSRLQRNRGLARARKAGARARKRLRVVGRQLEGSADANFHEEVARALVDYVADRFNRSSAGLTYEMADELLASRGLDSELRRSFRSCLETCDFARFVPASGQSERRAELLREANDLIERLERAR